MFSLIPNASGRKRVHVPVSGGGSVVPAGPEDAIVDEFVASWESWKCVSIVGWWNSECSRSDFLAALSYNKIPYSVSTFDYVDFLRV